MPLDVLETLKKLPPECFSTLPSDRCRLIGLHRGVPGYTPLKRCDTPEAAEDLAAHWNANRGVTDAQREAMIAGSMFGWHVPAADPDAYTGEGRNV
jgi:hypothetical protein